MFIYQFGRYSLLAFVHFIFLHVCMHMLYFKLILTITPWGWLNYLHFAN